MKDGKASFSPLMRSSETMSAFIFNFPKYTFLFYHTNNMKRKGGEGMILRGKMKKIVRIVLDLITWILVAAVVGYLVLLLTGHELYVVKSGSMEPAIHTGSVCIVNTNADYDDMKVGDIVAFKSGKAKVTHRVKAVTREGIETKGDANDHSDGISVNPENFIGENIYSVPYIGYGLIELSTMRGKIILITGIAVILLLGALVKEDEKEAKNEEKTVE
jgi:signal peptidase